MIFTAFQPEKNKLKIYSFLGVARIPCLSDFVPLERELLQDKMKNWSVLVAVVILFCAVSPSQSCEVEGRWTARQRSLFYNLDLTMSLHPNSSYTAEVTPPPTYPDCCMNV